MEAPCVAHCQRALTFRIHPLSVQVGQGSLVAQLLERLGRFLVDKTTATPPPGLLCFEGHGVAAVRGGAVGAQTAGPRVACEAQARGAIEEYGRQLGGGREEWKLRAEGLLAGRCVAVVPVQVPLRSQQATGVGGRGRGRGGRSGSYGSALWTDYGLRSVSTGCRRCRVGSERSGRASGGAGSGRAMRSSSQRAGWAGVGGKAAAVWCLSCACESLEEGKVPGASAWKER